MNVIKLICYYQDFKWVKRRTPLEWTHTSCGSPLYLDREANIHCFVCPETYLILDSRFKCSKCQNSNYTRLCQVLVAIANFDLKKVGMDNFTQDSLMKFLDDFTENIFKRTIK